jgi:hypothetical protein
MDWGGFSASINLASATVSAAWVLPPLTARNSYVDPTIMRTKMQLSMRNSTTSGFGLAGVGLIAWDAKDNTVPSPPPNPVIDHELDWMHLIINPYVSGVAGGSVVDTVADSLMLSSAKRRLGNSKGLLMVFANQSGASIDFIAYGRYLLKE